MDIWQFFSCHTGRCQLRQNNFQIIASRGTTSTRRAHQEAQTTSSSRSTPTRRLAADPTTSVASGTSSHQIVSQLATFTIQKIRNFTRIGSDQNPFPPQTRRSRRTSWRSDRTPCRGKDLCKRNRGSLTKSHNFSNCYRNRHISTNNNNNHRNSLNPKRNRNSSSR